MTNEEILASWDYGIELDEDFHRILELARADEREKMQGVESDWHDEYEVVFSNTEIGNMECKSCGKKINGEDFLLKKRRNFSLRGNENDAWFLYHRECSNDRVEWLQHDKRKMQGVEVWVSWDEDKHTMLSLSVPVLSIDKPEYNNHSIVGKNYRYNDNDDYSAGLTREIAKHLNIQQGQCKKFRIVEVGNE